MSKKNNNLPQVLERTYNEDEIIKLKNEITSYEVKREEIIDFVGEENPELLDEGETAIILASFFNLDKNKFVNLGINFLEENPLSSDHELSKKLLREIAKNDSLVGELATEILEEDWSDLNV